MRKLERDRILWARWRVRTEGRIEVVATVSTDAGYREERAEYASLAEATAELGASFQDVVSRSLEAGADRGRWRP